MPDGMSAVAVKISWKDFENLNRINKPQLLTWFGGTGKVRKAAQCSCFLQVDYSLVYSGCHGLAPRHDVEFVFDILDMKIDGSFGNLKNN